MNINSQPTYKHGSQKITQFPCKSIDLIKLTENSSKLMGGRLADWVSV